MTVIVITSCKKETGDNGHGSGCHDICISPEISNFKFKKGTYWVYIDSVSLLIDTMRVDSVLFNGMTDAPQCYKTLDYYCFQVNNGSPKNKYSLQTNKLMLNQLDFLGNGTIIYVDSSPKLDSLFVFDRYYRSVVSYTHASEPSENNNKTVFYSNTAFGFLKKEVFNSSNQLVSKKLLKDKVIIR